MSISELLLVVLRNSIYASPQSPCRLGSNTCPALEVRPGSVQPSPVHSGGNEVWWLLVSAENSPQEQPWVNSLPIFRPVYKLILFSAVMFFFLVRNLDRNRFGKGILSTN